MIATTPEKSKRLLELGLDPKTADMYYLPQVMNEGETLWPIDEGYDLDDADQPAWSLSALLEVMPRPDLYRETADLWVCVTFFKEGTIRGFGETAIEAACDTITKMFGRGCLKKKEDNDGRD